MTLGMDKPPLPPVLEGVYIPAKTLFLFSTIVPLDVLVFGYILSRTVHILLYILSMLQSRDVKIMCASVSGLQGVSWANSRPGVIGGVSNCTRVNLAVASLPTTDICA